MSITDCMNNTLSNSTGPFMTLAIDVGTECMTLAIDVGTECMTLAIDVGTECMTLAIDVSTECMTYCRTGNFCAHLIFAFSRIFG